MNKKQQGVRALVIIVVVIGFFYISEHFQEQEKTSISVDEELFLVADSIDEMHDIQFTNMERYQADMLKRVYRYNLMNTFKNIKIPVMDLNRDLQIHESWNDMFSFYLLYSMNILPEDEKPESIPSLNFDGFTLHNDSKEKVRLDIDHLLHGQNGFSELSEGVVYNGRLYRALWINPRMNEKVFQQLLEWSDGTELSITNINKVFQHVANVSFNDVTLVNSAENETKIKEFSLEMDFSNGTEPLATIPVNQTINFGESGSVHFTEFEVGLGYKRLYFESTQANLTKFHLNINGISHQYMVQQEENGKMFIHLPDNLDNPTDQYVLKLTNAIVNSDHELTATITTEELTAFKPELLEDLIKARYVIDRKIGAVDQSAYVLHQIKTNTDGSEGVTIGFELEVKVTKDQDELMDLHFRDYTSYQEQIERHPSIRDNYPYSFIKATDQNGNPIRIIDNYQYNNTSFFGMEKGKFEKLNEINIRLFQLPKRLPFSDNEITIRLPKKLQSE